MPRSVWSGAMVTWFERMTECVHAEGGYFENTEPGMESVHVPRSPHPETFGVTLVHMYCTFHSPKFHPTQRSAPSESRTCEWSMSNKCGSETRIVW